MSIGIAISLGTKVLAVADGRTTTPFSQGPPADSTKKLEALGPGLVAIHFGIRQVTVEAVPLLQQPMDLAEIEDRVLRAVTAAWARVEPRFAPDVDRQHSSMRAALILAGFRDGQSFVAGGLCGTAVEPSSAFATGSGARIVLGGEGASAQDHFDGLAGSSFAAAAVQGNTPTQEILLEDCIATIGCAAASDPTIGGTIRYAVVEDGVDVLIHELDSCG